MQIPSRTEVHIIFMSENESGTFFRSLHEVKHRKRDVLKCNIKIKTFQSVTSNEASIQKMSNSMIHFKTSLIWYYIFKCF